MKSAIVLGGLTFVAAKFIFDASSTKAVVWAAGVAFLGYWVANQKPGLIQAPATTPELPFDQTEPLSGEQKPA